MQTELCKSVGGALVQTCPRVFQYACLSPLRAHLPIIVVGAFLHGRGFVAVDAGRRSLVVERDGRDVVISNGPLLVKLMLRDGGHAQEFMP